MQLSLKECKFIFLRMFSLPSSSSSLLKVRNVVQVVCWFHPVYPTRETYPQTSSCSFPVFLLIFPSVWLNLVHWLHIERNKSSLPKSFFTTLLVRFRQLNSFLCLRIVLQCSFCLNINLECWQLVPWTSTLDCSCFCGLLDIWSCQWTSLH